MKKLLALAAFAAVTHCGTKKPTDEKIEITAHLLTAYNEALDKAEQNCVKKMQTRAQTRAKAKEICEHLIGEKYIIENCIRSMKESSTYSPEKFKEAVETKVEAYKEFRLEK